MNGLLLTGKLMRMASTNAASAKSYAGLLQSNLVFSTIQQLGLLVYTLLIWKLKILPNITALLAIPTV